MSTGDKIKRLRVERNMTQEQLGEKLGVKKSAVAKYENDRVRNLKRKTLLKLADVFGVPPSYFIDDLKKSNSHIGSILRTVREEKGLSRTDVALALNLKESEVFDIEIFPDEESISKAQKIASFLELDFLTLFDLDYSKYIASKGIGDYLPYIEIARSNYFTNRIVNDLAAKLKDNSLTEHEKKDLYRDIMLIADLRLSHK